MNLLLLAESNLPIKLPSDLFFVKALCLGAFIMAAGCIRYVPKPLEPTDEVKSLLARIEQPIEEKVSHSLMTKWFPIAEKVSIEDGLNVEEANSLALYYSPEIVQARGEAKIATAQVLSGGLLGNPELFLGPRFTEDSKTILPAYLALEIPLPGELSTEEKIASTHAESKKWELAVREVEVLKKVRDKFVAYSAAEKKIEILKRLSAIGDAVLRWSEALYKSGEVDALSFSLTKASNQEIRIELEEESIELSRIQRELLELIGIIATSQFRLIVDASLPDLSTVSSDNQTLFRNPYLQAAKASYNQAEAELKQEIIRQYPNFNIGPQFERSDGEDSLGFGVGFSIPIFNWNRGKIKEAEQRRNAAHKKFQSVLVTAMHRRDRAQFDQDAIQRLLVFHRQGYLAAAMQTGKSLEERLATGVANVPEILSAQSTLAKAKIKEIELESEYQNATLRYAVASGAAFNEAKMEQ
jgi:cobalt-zinc-cadmium efflux system outer membrane protein